MRRRFDLALAAAAFVCAGCTTTGANPFDAAVDGEGASDAIAIDAGGASTDACCTDGMLGVNLDASGPESGSDAGLSC